MSLKVNFFCYLFDTNTATIEPYHGNGLRVEGRITYSVGVAVNPAYCLEWADSTKRSFMFGLLVDAASGQQVDVEYKNKAGNWFMLDKENDVGGPYKIVDQLNMDPGIPAGGRWVGFSQPAGVAWVLDDSKIAGGEIQFDARVGIYPSTGPEFIPFVGRHLRNKDEASNTFSPGSFSAGHMPSTWYVPKDKRTAADGKQWVYGPRGRRWL